MQNDSFLKNESKGGGRGGLGYNYLEGAKFLKKWDFFGNFFLHRSKPFYGNPATLLWKKPSMCRPLPRGKMSLWDIMEVFCALGE